MACWPARVETDAARSYVTFTLDPAARFSDGKPVTADDVIFSWQLLRDNGRPNYRTYYAKVAKAEASASAAVRFDLAGGDDRELPLILGLMPVLAKHAIDPDTFEDTSFEPIDRQRALHRRQGRSGHERHARAQSATIGAATCRSIAASGISTRSASTIYRDANSHLEAFKNGLYDVRTENDPAAGRPPTTFPAVRDGRVVKETFPTGLPKAMLSSSSSTRGGRSLPTSACARRSALLFDFEWVNHNFFFDRYRRSASYFEDSELSARGRPADARERALLAPFPGAVRADVLDGTWSPPVSRRLRPRPRHAAARARAA